MKIYYIGTICSDKTFNNITDKSKVKPSISAQVFEDSLLTGINENKNIEISAHTFLTIASYPNGYKLFIPPRKEILKSGISTQWYMTINFAFLKQWGYCLSAFFSLLYWLIKNSDEKDKVIFCCSIFSFIARPVTFLAKIFKTETCVIVTDLTKFNFSLKKPTGMKKIFSNHFLNSQIKYQSKFDKYILLTEYMKDELDVPDKPCLIIEGIVNKNLFVANKKYINLKKEKAVMYAGMLNKKHRIEMLIKGFMLTKGDYELWLFGSGDFEREIQEYAKNDKRIKFFGRVNRNVVLEYEHRASLLVNIRDSKEEYTKFSFPSKTIEYMACGTPLLTTKLPGIPDEYYEYCYTLDDETVDGVNKSLENILSLPQDELLTKGKEAMNFIFSNKIAGIQGNKIIEFLSVNRGGLYENIAN